VNPAISMSYRLTLYVGVIIVFKLTLNDSSVNRYVPKRSVTNFLLFNTLIGSGLYIYNRAHLNAAPVNLRLAYR
jgi:hypothetical protein